MIATLLMIHFSFYSSLPENTMIVSEREVREELERDNKHANMLSLSSKKKTKGKKGVPETKIKLR